MIQIGTGCHIDSDDLDDMEYAFFRELESNGFISEAKNYALDVVSMTHTGVYRTPINRVEFYGTLEEYYLARCRNKNKK